MPARGEAETLAEPRSEASDHADPGSEARKIGARLRNARIGLGRDVKDLARELRIREAWLLAIEEGRLDELPDTPYRFGFVRSYANRLGLDGAALAARLEAVAGAAEGGRRPGVFLRDDGGRLPGRRVLALTAVLAIAVGGGWYLAADVGAPPDRAVPMPERSSDPAEERPGAGKGSDTAPVPGVSAAQSGDESPIPLPHLGTDAVRLDGAGAAAPDSPAGEAAPSAPARSRAAVREPVGAGAPSPADRGRSTAPGPWDAGRVRAVQRALARLGYDPGPFDGVVGLRTRAAVRAFQAAAGLTADGRLTPELEREIRSAADATGS